MSALTTMITVSHPSHADRPAPVAAGPALAAKWLRAFDTLVERECFDPPERDADGCSWLARIHCSLSTGAKVQKAMPGDHVLGAQYWQERFDESGKPIGIVLEMAVWACDAERAIFSYYDHWQAGLCGSVWVYDSDESYRRARDAAVLEAKEAASVVTINPPRWRPRW